MDAITDLMEIWEDSDLLPITCTQIKVTVLLAFLSAKGPGLLWVHWTDLL